MYAYNFCNRPYVITFVRNITITFHLKHLSLKKIYIQKKNNKRKCCGMMAQSS